jgi:hypothetical protein
MKERLYKIIAKNVTAQIDMPEDVAEQMRVIGTAQRGAPETAMLKAQMALGGGLLGVLLEHVGDLSHRMTHQLPNRTGQWEVEEKTKKTLRWLQSGYGIAREIEENAFHNSEAQGLSVEEYWAKMEPLLQTYSSEHRKLPAYNRPQWLAREAAIAVGQKNYSKATSLIEELDSMVKSDNWDGLATAYETDASGNLVEYS